VIRRKREDVPPPAETKAKVIARPASAVSEAPVEVTPSEVKAAPAAPSVEAVTPVPAPVVVDKASEAATQAARVVAKKLLSLPLHQKKLHHQQ